MNAYADIRPEVQRLAAEIQAKRTNTPALLRLLREFGLACYRLGFNAGQLEAATPPSERATVPAPARADEPVTGRYSLQHPLHDDHVPQTKKGPKR